MVLSEISLKQFRSYENRRFVFDKNVTLITGNNGTGKTNLLEAIYVLLQGSSFRVGDKDLIRNGDEWWRIDGVLEDEPRQVRFQPEHRPPKQLIVHDTVKRFTYKDRLPVVLFEPTDLQLLHGSPSRRRDALDVMLSSLSYPYKLALGRYERALLQRNNILKKNPANLEDILFSWDVLLSEYGIAIIEARRGLVGRLNATLEGYYSEIAGDINPLRIEYKSEITQSLTPTLYLGSLHSKLSIDKLRGTTSVGPHRDDIDFVLREDSAKLTASRGEVRTILLALKLSYASLLEEVYAMKPLILLDDVFSELDSLRQDNVIKLINHNQVIITDTAQGLDVSHQIKLTLAI